MKILLLEDNTADAYLTVRALSGALKNATIKVAPTLSKARELLQKESPFDVALLDMKLPDGNGMDLLFEIKQSGAKMATIMLTGHGNEEVAVSALKSGADDYVVKREGYLNKLSGIIEYTINNFKKKAKQKSEIIDVLYVEHHKSDIDLTIRHIKQYAPNIHINNVFSAEEALDRISRNETTRSKYKAILIDYHLPGLNAIEFIKIIRQEIKLKTPIILITGQGNEDIAVHALKLGANEYLTKNENYLYRLPSLIMNVYQHCELEKNQLALAESESKYRLLADNSGDVIFVLNMDLKYTYVSPAVETLRGYCPEEAIKQHINEVLTPDSLKVANNAIKEILLLRKNESEKKALQKTIQLEMFRKDKSTVWTEVKASLIIDENKNPTGILGVTRDISKRKMATNELRKLSQAVEQNPASIIITDTEGAIEYTNPKFTEITGYTLDEVKGKNPRILNSGNNPRKKFDLLWKTILTGGEWRGELQNKHKNGTLFWESASISAIKNDEGEIIHFLSIKEDITEKKERELELIEAKEHAEESDRLKSSFLANMSHEIRTPMNSIMGFASLLPEEESKMLMSQYAQIIVQNSEQLVSIIDGIVLYSKLQSRLFTFQPILFNVKKLLTDIEKSFNLPEYQKEVKLSVDFDLTPETMVLSDYEKIRQVLTNLVSNAFKYTTKGEIIIGFVVRNNSPEFYVMDTGIGIPEKEQLQVFERFYRGSNVNQSALRGTGLGLSIVKELIEILGGKIWIESEIGKGTKFCFSLNSTEQQ